MGSKFNLVHSFTFVRIKLYKGQSEVKSSNFCFVFIKITLTLDIYCMPKNFISIHETGTKKSRLRTTTSGSLKLLSYAMIKLNVERNGEVTTYDTTQSFFLSRIQSNHSV